MFAFASEFSGQRRQSDDSIEPLAILLAAPSIGTRDPEIGARQLAGAQLAEESDDSVRGLAGRLVDPVQPFRHPVEVVAHCLDPLVMLFVNGPRLAEFQRALEVSVDFLAIGLVGMQFQAKRTETALLQPGMHHVQGGALLRDEKNRLAVTDRTSDDVRDRLRLARAGRALHD